MEAKQHIDEMLDRYLSGQMTDKQRSDFELQIASDPQLQAEVKLHARIIDTIKAKNAKKLLQKREAQIQQDIRRKRVFVRTLSSIAAAACMVLGIIHFNGVSAYKSYGDQYYAAMDILAARGGDNVDLRLQKAYELIGSADYDLAHENIDAAIVLLQNEQFDLATEEGRYFEELNRQKADDAEWLKAIAYMKQGKRHKARVILRRIAEGDGIYKTDAIDILK